MTTLAGLGLVRTVKAMRTDVIGEQRRLHATHGDWVHFGWPLRFSIARHPHVVRHVLVDNAANYKKSASYTELRALLGNGLITSDGEHWRKNRRMIGPLFTKATAREAAPSLRSELERMLSTLRAGTYDVAELWSDHVFAAATAHLFGDHIRGRAHEVHAAIRQWETRFVRRVYALVKLPDAWPTPDTQRGLRTINKIVADVVDQAKRDAPSTSVLSRLLAMPDRLPDAQLRDELMTLLLAAHDTTSTALTWTCSLLARHPRIQDDVRDEVRGARQGAALPLLRSVIEESLRLHPPVPSVSREAIADDVICGVHVAAGTKIEMTVHATQRHPDFFEAPDSFVPSRFSDDKRHTIDADAYLPFGRGQRLCAGRELALVHLEQAMAEMIARFRMVLPDGADASEPTSFASITMRPKHGMPLVLVDV
jgi:cytochrome P450